jgi:hypothetical protein
MTMDYNNSFKKTPLIEGYFLPEHKNSNILNKNRQFIEFRPKF